MDKSISFLLGAGFSAPTGYPIGNVLNQKLFSCTGDDFAFNSDGRLSVRTDGKKPNLGYKTSYDVDFDFCRDLIQYFNTIKGYFDYEEFYDFFVDDAKSDLGVIDLFKTNFIGRENEFSLILSEIKKIYNQLIIHYLKDENNEAWYDDAPIIDGPSFFGYTGILNCLKKMREDSDINVHTLNHDLFFERLNRSEWLNGELCDGFEELGSPYYGDLNIGCAKHKCRLPYYTGNYANGFRLFKLHGSIDYAIFKSSYGVSEIPNKYVKTSQRIGISNLYREFRNENGDHTFEHCWVNYHADFLTGTTAKIMRYDEPFLYRLLFKHFIDNLLSADKIVIIGYGGKDIEINKIILENFDFRHKPSFIIDPFPGDKLKLLQNQLNSKLVIKNLEDIQMEDFT